MCVSTVFYLNQNNIMQDNWDIYLVLIAIENSFPYLLCKGHNWNIKKEKYSLWAAIGQHSQNDSEC